MFNSDAFVPISLTLYATSKVSMKEVIRKRVIQALTFLACLVTFPHVLTVIWPQYSALLPPTLLLVLIVMSIIEGLLAWRPSWTVTKIIGDTPEVSRVLKNMNTRPHAIAAAISISVSLLLLFIWLKGLA